MFDYAYGTGFEEDEERDFFLEEEEEFEGEEEFDDDSWDLEVGFDPYEGCYSYDC